MALDKENKTPAYLCGRLFAVLEDLQQDSARKSKESRESEEKEVQDERLYLTYATGIVLKAGAELLGIQMPDRM